MCKKDVAGIFHIQYDLHLICLVIALLKSSQCWNNKIKKNEWMNEWGIYIALYCVLLYTQSDLQSCGGSLLNHHQCAASISQWRQCAHHTPATGGEEREWWSQSSGWGLLGGHDGQMPVEWIYQDTGVTPLLFTRSAMRFLMTTESQDPRFNVSSERRCFLTVFKIQELYLSHTRLYREYITSSEMWVSIVDRGQYSVPVTILGH